MITWTCLSDLRLLLKDVYMSSFITLYIFCYFFLLLLLFLGFCIFDFCSFLACFVDFLFLFYRFVILCIESFRSCLFPSLSLLFPWAFDEFLLMPFNNSTINASCKFSDCKTHREGAFLPLISGFLFLLLMLLTLVVCFDLVRQGIEESVKRSSQTKQIIE